MRSLNDPIRRRRTQLWLTWLTGSIVIVICLVWATAPLEVSQPPYPDVKFKQPGPPSPGSDSIELDPNAFAVQLWNPAPSPDLPQQQTVSERHGQSIRLELIGIIAEDGDLKAALYDPDTDRLLVVRNGDRIRNHTVTAISTTTVELSDGRSIRRLSLREGRS